MATDLTTDWMEEGEPALVDGTPQGVAVDDSAEGIDGTPQGVAVDFPTEELAFNDSDCGIGPHMFQSTKARGKGRPKRS